MYVRIYTYTYVCTCMYTYAFQHIRTYTHTYYSHACIHTRADLTQGLADQEEASCQDRHTISSRFKQYDHRLYESESESESKAHDTGCSIS